MLSGSMVGIILSLAVAAGVFMLGVILLYAIIWRAVRRGLREFHYPAVKPGRPETQQYSVDPRA